jgi:hypothetical protein
MAAPVPTTGGLPPVDSSHNPVLWPDQIDPVAVHAAVLIAQEAYRNQKALEGLAMLVQVPSGPKSDGPIATRPGARGEVRPPTLIPALDPSVEQAFIGHSCKIYR